MIKIRNEKGEYPCYLCSDTFHAKKDLRLHTISTHKDPSNLTCTYCQYEFKDISSVRRHIKTVHINVKEYLCSFCRKYYSHKYDLEQHFRKVHKNKPIVDNYRHCSECKKLCLSWAELKQHLQDTHGKKIQHINCPFCMKIFFDPGYLKQHFKRVHPNSNTHSVIFCQECGKVFENSDSLIQHTVEAHHWDAELVEFCQKKNCEGVFKNKAELAQHTTEEHGGGEQYQCPCCEEMFTEKVQTVAHITTVHSWDCVLECNKCNSWFKSGDEVNAHNCVVVTRTGTEITDDATKRKTAILDSALGQRQSGEIVKNRKYVHVKPCAEDRPRISVNPSEFDYCEDTDQSDISKTGVQGNGSPIRNTFVSAASSSKTQIIVTDRNVGDNSGNVGNVGNVGNDATVSESVEDGLSSVNAIIDTVSSPLPVSVFDMPKLPERNVKKRKIAKK